MALYPWHFSLYQQLITPFSQGRGHHALLFKTEQGLGTETLIRTFAHWLLCQQKNNDQPCGGCKSCLLVQSGNHPDFHLLEPIENRDIGVEQVREMTTKLQMFAQQEGNVVVYLRQVERLTEAACNALLKTLEEPRQGVYFLLEADWQSPVMATIQSRCQTWLVHAPECEMTIDWLKTQVHHSEQEIALALRLCYHRPLICKDFLIADRLPQRKAFLRAFWQFFTSRDLFTFYTHFAKEKADVQLQLDWLSSFFTDSLKAKMGIDNDWLNQDLGKAIPMFSQALTADRLLKGHAILQQTQRDLVEVNAVNVELMVVNGLTKLALEVFGC